MKELKSSLLDKDEELQKLKRNLKVTQTEELEQQVKVNEEELVRLKELLIESYSQHTSNRSELERADLLKLT